AVAAAWMSAFRTAKYAWLTWEAYRRIPWTPQLKTYFYGHFRLLLSGDNPLYVRVHPGSTHWPGGRSADAQVLFSLERTSGAPGRCAAWERTRSTSAGPARRAPRRRGRPRPTTPGR